MISQNRWGKVNGGQSTVTGGQEAGEAKSGTKICHLDYDASKTGKGGTAVNFPIRS